MKLQQRIDENAAAMIAAAAASSGDSVAEIAARYEASGRYMQVCALTADGETGEYNAVPTPAIIARAEHMVATNFADCY